MTAIYHHRRGDSEFIAFEAPQGVASVRHEKDGRQQGDAGSTLLEAKLPGRNRAYINKTDDGMSFDQPVYAINWFDTKTRWVYDFYNVLAVRSVRAVGGAPFFKGRLEKILHGAEEHRRDVLLVVRYPSLRNFKTMLESPFFLVVSVLRLMAVRDFTFGFTRRRDKGPDLSPGDLKVAYAVHHFKGAGDFVEKIGALCRAENAEPFYAGTIGAFITTGDIVSTGEPVPCLMDAIVIWKSGNQNDLEKFIGSDSYQSFLNQTDSSFIGIYDRVI